VTPGSSSSGSSGQSGTTIPEGPRPRRRPDAVRTAPPR
jgi:hypothetical protein